MDLIYTIDTLISVLDETPVKDYPSVMKSIRLSNDEFKPFEIWKESGYSRNCIVRSPNYEIVLLCWNAGDATPIHDHNGQKCWVYQVEGSISEKRYKYENAILLETLSTKLSPGKLTYMDDKMGYHALVNDSSANATTLHIYLNPIDVCGYFCDEEKIFKKKSLHYDAFFSQRVITT